MTYSRQVMERSLIVIVIGLSLLVIVSSLNLGGLSMFVVRSGSMSPAIPTGSAVMVTKQESYAKGEVVTFRTSGDIENVTHRIESVDTSGYQKVYTVKGDANDAVDSEPVNEEQIVGRVTLTIPLLGYLIAFGRTLPGLIMLIIIPSILIMALEIRTIAQEANKIKNRRHLTA